MAGAQRWHAISGRAILALALVALVCVLSGYFQPPQLDEGSAAHIFQLAVAALMPLTVVFLATADWRHPGRSLRRLVLPAVILGIALAALYYLEHYYYLPFYR